LSIYRYPEAPPAQEDYNLGLADAETGAIDYLMLRRERFDYDSNNVPAFYNRNLPGNRATVVQHPDRCYIAIPPGIQTSYGPSYRRADIGVSGVTATQMLKSGTDFSNLAETLQDAASAALPEFSTNVVLQMVNGFNNFVGLQGNLDLNAIENLQNGRIFNPYSEQIFQGMSFRTHNFAFKFFARTPTESKQIQSIIDYIKIGSMPRVQQGAMPEQYVNNNESFGIAGEFSKQKDTITRSSDKGHKFKGNIYQDDFFKKYNEGYAKKNRYFEMPDRFQLRFVRFGANADGSAITNLGESTRRDLMFKIYPSVCTGISVNYTPDNQYVAFKQPQSDGISVPAIVLTISFTETRLLTENDVAVGY
tara:strand:- start:421 stop:1509 length:1089 start_codon:yes stop_codon:yes gene_type:complete